MVRLRIFRLGHGLFLTNIINIMFNWRINSMVDSHVIKGCRCESANANFFVHIEISSVNKGLLAFGKIAVEGSPTQMFLQQFPGWVKLMTRFTLKHPVFLLRLKPISKLTLKLVHFLKGRV